MNDILVLSLSVITALVLLYWFWPGKAKCEKCQAELDDFAYCSNLACPYAARMQPFE